MTYKQEQLAYEIAEALKDNNALPLFMSYTEKFPEALLREKLSHVLSLPQDKIRKSRAALFTYLIEQYARRESRRSWY